MTNSDLIALLSVVIAIATAVASVWANRSTGRQEFERRADAIEYSLQRALDVARADKYIIDIVAGALHAIANRQAVLYQLATRDEEDEFYAGEDNREAGELNKKLTELGLFSQDAVRRISAQRTLAHSYGDQRSLELMRRIERGEVGERDKEILEQIEVLERRLDKPGGQVKRWGGRPGGGEF
jgi:hypothetical protein